MRAHTEASILIVDDDMVDRKAARRALTRQDMPNPILEASDGADALELLRRPPADPDAPTPCLVLLDINMPRMNGIEFLTELRRDERLRSTVVFVLTTSRADQDLQDAYRHNIAGYVVKSEAGNGFSNLIRMLDHYLDVVEFPPDAQPPPGRATG